MADRAGREQVRTSPADQAGWPIAPALVHVFTATGIVCALFATLATLDGAWTTAFLWLGIAFIVDGVDGTLARLAHVHTRLPRFSGERLDMVVDYVTYVFVPALMMLRSGILPGWLGVAAACYILMSSLFHFSDTASKTDDQHFVGFPAIWNLVAFYLFAFPVPEWVALLVVAVCGTLTFVPMRWLHPMRVRRLMGVNVAATAVWSGAAAWVVLVTGLPATGVAKWLLAAVALYGIALACTLPLADARPKPKG
jgi:phosphatidylcholine synthase